MFYKNALRKIRKKGECPFCIPPKNFIIFENPKAYLTPSRAPYVKDHLLVIPKVHALVLDKLNSKEKESILNLIVKGIDLLKKKYPAVAIEYKEGDLDKSGKTIPHLHFHLLPKMRRNESFNPGSKRRFLSEKELIKEVKRIKFMD